MKIVKKYKISKEAELIFAKHDSKKILKKYEFSEHYNLALMELGTNLYKHAGSGEIWIIEDENDLLIASVDEGKGIENLNWALRKGSTSLNNSLGLGLYSLRQIKGFEFEVFSKKDFGSIFLFKKQRKKDSLFLQSSFYDDIVSGDFIYKKDKFLVIGDVSGHGIKAYKSAQKIQEFLKKELTNCQLIDDIINNLHLYIKQNRLRSVVLSVIKNSKKVEICGVGNIDIFVKDLKISQYSQAKGMIGEVFHKVSKYNFERENNIIILKTDGISDKIVKMFLEKNYSKEMIAIGAIFYSKRNDDKTILILGDTNG